MDPKILSRTFSHLFTATVGKKKLASIVSGILTSRRMIKIHLELRAMAVHLDQDKFSSTLLNFHLNAACLIQASGRGINNGADSLR